MKLFQLPIALFLCSLLFVQLVKGQVEGELDAEDGLGGNDMTQKAEEEALGGEGLPEGTMPDEGGLDGEKTSDFYRAGVEATDSEQELTDNNTNSELSLASSTPATPEVCVDDAGVVQGVAEESIAQLGETDENPQPTTTTLKPPTSPYHNENKDHAAEADSKHEIEKIHKVGKPVLTKSQKINLKKKIRKQKKIAASNPKPKKTGKGGNKGKAKANKKTDSQTKKKPTSGNSKA